MKYAYQRNGSPLLSWNRAAPQQTRAADAKALGCCGCSGSSVTVGFGSLGGTSLDGPTVEMPLPRAGAPEPLPNVVLGGITETIKGMSTPAKVAGVVGAFLLYKHLKKRR